MANPRFVCDWYVHESANPSVGEGSKIQYMPPRAKKKSSSKNFTSKLLNRSDGQNTWKKNEIYLMTSDLKKHPYETRW